MAISVDGSFIAATDYGGYIYTYSSTEVTWTAQTYAGVDRWTSIDVSADGSVILAGVDGGPLHLSSDTGLTWAR